MKAQFPAGSPHRPLGPLSYCQPHITGLLPPTRACMAPSPASSYHATSLLDQCHAGLPDQPSSCAQCMPCLLPCAPTPVDTLCSCSPPIAAHANTHTPPFSHARAPAHATLALARDFPKHNHLATPAYTLHHQPHVIRPLPTCMSPMLPCSSCTNLSCLHAIATSPSIYKWPL